MVLIWLIKVVFCNFFYYNFFLYLKMSEFNSIGNTDLTHYQKNRERLRGQARDKYRNLSEEKKN